MRVVPTRIRDAVYPSIRVAAEAEGVHRNTILKALRRGTIDNVGLGQGKPCTHDGVTYPTIRAASRATGIPETTLSYRMRRLA